MRIAETRSHTLRTAGWALAVLGIALYCSARIGAQTASGDDALATFTRAQLEAAVEQTRHEASRMEGLHALIRMAGIRLYEGSLIGGDPDPERFQMRGEAAKGVSSCRDVATVGKALDSPYRSVRLWGVMTFETRDGKTEEWRPLVPKLIGMLNGPDAEWRQKVADKLWAYADGKAALAERERVETDPYVLLRIARSGGNPALYEDLVRLLTSGDAKVREGELEFIASETGEKAIAAPMWRLRFDEAVYARVQNLTRSNLAAERERARKALIKMEEVRGGQR